MTIERPMFPPRGEEGNVIQFAEFAAAAKLAKEDSRDSNLARYRDERRAKREARLAEVATAPETLTETCRNHRLRLSRRDAWWDARRWADYWRARCDWASALSSAQDHDIADANSYPKCDGKDRWPLLDPWRAALVQQMLTPAPDLAAVSLAGNGRNSATNNYIASRT
jgi:hypothetical protein